MQHFRLGRPQTGRRTIRARQGDRSRSRWLRCEALEPRALLAALVWTNRLTASDTLTAAERAVVDQALAWWNTLVIERPQVGPLALTILGGAASGMDLGGNVTSFVTVQTSGNGTASATLRIDADAGGRGWYVDPQPADHQEFAQKQSEYLFTGGPAGLDLYSVVLHELAHALGFGTSPAFFSRLTAQADGTYLYRGAAGLQAVLDGDRGHLSAAAHPQDLLNASLAPATRYLPSRLVVSLLADAHGYLVNLPPLASQGTFFFGAAQYVAAEGGAAVQLVVHRGPSSGQAEVSYQVVSGTAQAGVDYELLAGRLAFGEGEFAKSITIHVLADEVQEDPEWLRVELQQPSAAAALGARTGTTVYIIDRADANWLARLYSDVLGRGASAAELAWWQERLALGQPRSQIAAAFVTSRERRTTQLEAWYQQYLGRGADVAGLSWWLAVWQSQGMHAVQAGLLASAESFNRAGGVQAWVSELYRVLLDREAASHEIAWWVHRASSTSREAVARSFLFSEEYGLLQLGAWYTTYLRREPDAAGTMYWLAELRKGTSPELVQAAILASPEYRSRQT